MEFNCKNRLQFICFTVCGYLISNNYCKWCYGHYYVRWIYQACFPCCLPKHQTLSCFPFILFKFLSKQWVNSCFPCMLWKGCSDDLMPLHPIIPPINRNRHSRDTRKINPDILQWDIKTWEQSESSKIFQRDKVDKHLKN